MRPTSRSAAASSFWRGYAASLRRSWLGRMVPADMVAATRKMSAQLRSIRFHVHLAADQRAQALRDARAFEHVEGVSRAGPGCAGRTRSRGSRTRRKTWSVKPARVGVLFADAPPGLVHQEPVEDVGRFVDGGRNGLDGERRVPVGERAR